MPDPLVALPNEMWAWCIQFVIYEDTAGSLEYLMVSRRWQTLLLGTPSLWNRIYIHNGEDEMARVRTFLYLSQDCPLHLEITTALPTTECLDLIRPHLHRVETISIRSDASHPTTELYTGQWKYAAASIMTALSGQLATPSVTAVSCTGQSIHDEYPGQYRVNVMRFAMSHMATFQSGLNDEPTDSSSTSSLKILDSSLWEDQIAGHIEAAVRKDEGLKKQHDITGQVKITQPKPIFTGTYSDIYLGKMKGDQVAVKVIKSIVNKGFTQTLLARERRVWEMLDHPNILPFLGYAYDELFQPFGSLMSPWCSNGSAIAFLQQNEDTPHFQRILLWEGVVKGVSFLHGHSPRIIHGNLNPVTVLIDDNGMPKICHFAGVFLEEDRGMEESMQYKNPRYLAPELGHPDAAGASTIASDVYSVGCLGLEFIYSERPYAHRKDGLRSEGRIIKDILRGMPPARSAARVVSADYPWSLISKCWATDPDSRPSASTLLSTLLSPALISATLAQILRFSCEDPAEKEVQQVKVQWYQRIRHLTNMCLVSRTWRAHALPLLDDARQVIRGVETLLQQLSSQVDEQAVTLVAHALAGRPGDGNPKVTKVGHMGADAFTVLMEVPSVPTMLPRLFGSAQTLTSPLGYRTGASTDNVPPVWVLTKWWTNGQQAGRWMADNQKYAVECFFSKQYLDYLPIYKCVYFVGRLTLGEGEWRPTLDEAQESAAVRVIVALRHWSNYGHAAVETGPPGAGGDHTRRSATSSNQGGGWPWAQPLPGYPLRSPATPGNAIPMPEATPCTEWAS